MLVISDIPNYLSFILKYPLCEGLLSSEKDSNSFICYFFFCVLKEGVILFVIESVPVA